MQTKTSFGKGSESLKVDIILEAGVAPAAVAELAALAEQKGLHRLWSSAFAARRDPVLGLALAAQNTQNLKLGYMPVSPFEQQPMKIADTLLTLNEMSAGRASVLIGGLGKSSMMAMGLTPDRRVKAVRECVEILKAAASGVVTAYDGALFQAKGDYASWVTQTPPDIYIAANKEQMLRLAGSLGDGVMLSDITTHHMDEVFTHLRTGREIASRNPSAFHINNFWAWHVKADKQAAIAEARQELVWRGAMQRWHIAPFLEPDECDVVEANWTAFLNAFIQKSPVIDGVPESIISRLVDGLTFTGDLDDLDFIAERIKALEAAGQTEIALRLHRDPDVAIKTIGDHLLPKLI